MNIPNKLSAIAEDIVEFVRQRIEKHSINEQLSILEDVIQSLDEMNDEVLEQLDEED